MDEIIHEKELLQRIAESNESAFRQLFECYKERFYAAALKMTRSPNIAEEIVQEVFVTLWIRRETLTTVENPTSYFFTIVYNTISAHFKKLALEKKLKLKMGERAVRSERITEKTVEENETRQLLQEIICQLPPKQQQVYRLSKEEGMSRDEIAQQLHISPNTVKNHLLKAINYIREHWNKASLILLIFMK